MVNTLLRALTYGGWALSYGGYPCQGSQLCWNTLNKSCVLSILLQVKVYVCVCVCMCVFVCVVNIVYSDLLLTQ